jgi:chitinase
MGHNYRYILSVATSAGPEKYSKLPLSKINSVVDTIQLMTYDYAGDWDTTTGHASNVYPDKQNPTATKFNTNKAVTDYIAKGVNSKKILLGMPLYGRSFANTKGLGKTYRGTGKGSYEKGIWLFKDLPRPNAKVATRNDLIATYTYDSKTTEYVTLDGSATTKLKAKYLKSKGLGGAFFWEAMGDKTGTSSLVRIMAENMGGLDRSQNQLSYPASEFDNIRNGMPGV